MEALLNLIYKLFNILKLPALTPALFTSLLGSTVSIIIFILVAHINIKLILNLIHLFNNIDINVLKILLLLFLIAKIIKGYLNWQECLDNRKIIDEQIYNTLCLWFQKIKATQNIVDFKSEFFSGFSKLLNTNSFIIFSKSILAGSCLLSFFKLFGFIFSPFNNLVLLFAFIAIAKSLDLYNLIELFIVKFLRETLHPSILDYRDETYDGFISLWRGSFDMQEQFIIKKNQKHSLVNKITLKIFIYFIWLRLIFLRFTFSLQFVYLVFIYGLLFYQFNIFIQIISIILFISKLFFVLSMHNEKFLLYYLSNFFCDVLDKNVKIKPNYNNAVIISCVNLSRLNYMQQDLYKSEKYDPQFKRDYKLVNYDFIWVLLEENFIKVSPYELQVERKNEKS